MKINRFPRLAFCQDISLTAFVFEPLQSALTDKAANEHISQDVKWMIHT